MPSPRRTRGAARREAEANALGTPPKTNADAGSASNNSEAGPSGARAPAAPRTPKWHHRDPDDPDFQQQIVAASFAKSPTLYDAMENGRKKSAAILPAVTPPPANRKKAKTAAGAFEIPRGHPTGYPMSVRFDMHRALDDLAGLTTEQPHD